jgi:hypothetical protein
MDAITLRDFIAILLPALFGSVGGGYAAYTAIKVQIARADERIAAHKEATETRFKAVEKETGEAHKRIDDILREGLRVRA